MNSCNWEQVRSEKRWSSVFIQTGGRWLETVEVISGVHDDKLGEDVNRLKSRAMETLVETLFKEKRSFADYIHVFFAALSDPVFFKSGKAYALAAASTVKSPEVLSNINALIQNQELGFVRELLPGALYRQGDKSSLSMLTKDADEEVARKAKFLKAALSWKTNGKSTGTMFSDGNDCPNLDDHGVCLHGLLVETCPMLGGRIPYDFSRKVSTGRNWIVLPSDLGWRSCPRNRLTSPFDRLGLFAFRP